MIKNYIGGCWVESSSSFDVKNPCNGDVIANCSLADSKTVSEAVAVARNAAVNWRNTSRIFRADLFDKLCQLIKRDHNKLRDLISLETGKNLNESHAEVIEALHMAQLVAGMGRAASGDIYSSELNTKDVQIVRKPKGVVAVISPWNFPGAIGSFWCSAPALFEGNTVIHKPSELTPMIADCFAKLYEEAGFPKGVYNLIHGDGKVGRWLVESDVDMVLFTGSADVGREIRQHCAGTWSKSCSCEMGSKSAVMVFEDGDFNLGLDAAVTSAFKLSGQRCVSGSRILVERSIHQKFCDEFVVRAAKVRLVSPFEADANDGFTIGPLISREQVEKVVSYNDMVRQAVSMSDTPTTVLLDYVVPNMEGNWITPFVYSCEWADKPYLKQEVFGPHVAIIPFDNLEDAIRIYNDTEYGLALAAITDDFRKHRILRDNCKAGMFYINGSCIGAESHLPFKGVGKSGYGFASAAGTFDAVVHKMVVTTNFEEGKFTLAQGLR